MIAIILKIGAVAGAISAIFTLLILASKTIRTWFVDMVSKKAKEKQHEKMMLEIHNTLKEHIEQDKESRKELKLTNELQNEALLSLLRNNITHAYYKWMKLEYIPSYEKENLIKQYNVYHNLNGNSFIDEIYKEMLKLEVKI